MIFGSKKKGFTLVEMLIVIVIIGVLAAALIPRLTSVRGRANDVARKADIQQLATAIITYQMDFNGVLPDPGTGIGVSISAIASNLKTAGMDGIPVDPVSTTSISLGGSAQITGSYGYLRVEKDGIANAGFVLMSKTQTAGGSNRVMQPGSTNPAEGYISSGADTSSLTPCTSVLKTGAFLLTTGGACQYTGEAQLHYIMVR